ncbi:MAG: peptide chain release factor N(5)-glutamine methyltransferase [Desulfobulbales bacterium]
MQTKQVFENGVKHLKNAGIPEPELEVSLLLAHALQMERTALLLAGEKIIRPDQLALFEKNIGRRLTREPLAYITGEKEFWSLDFKVSEEVLIPRPETEFLLEKTLTVLRHQIGKYKEPLQILDLGTGSGVIAIVLALELVSAKITAVDYSYTALQVASHNAKRHKVAGKINFINCDWFEGLRRDTAFDVVISNPPYVGADILARPFGTTPDALQPEVGGYEPRLALDGGERGMREIGRIAAELGRMLKPRGWFFMESGSDQQKAILDIFARSATYDSIAFYNDYSGRPRVFQARKR